MHRIFREPAVKSSQRYISHVFADKAKSPATQAADFLSWHTYTDLRRQNEDKPRRKDFAALLRSKDQAVRVTRERMAELSAKWFAGNDSLARLHLGNQRG
jgi:hypothetical protein